MQSRRAFSWVIMSLLLVAGSGVCSAQTKVDPYITLRGSLDNCRIRFERDKVGRVVFLGGSITHMNGWRAMVSAEIQKRFPETKFEFVDAGIPSTGSVPGAFRFERDVLGGGPVDLLFEEAAVNDSTNGRSDTAQVRGMEGIIRHARLANPNTDIVMLYFVDDEKINQFKKGMIPPVIANHEKVASYYGVSDIDLAHRITDMIEAHQITWKEFGGIHPAPPGHKLYTESIMKLLDAAWAKPLAGDAKIEPHACPDKPLDTLSYFHGKLAGLDDAKLVEGFEHVPTWKPADRTGTRPGFVEVPMLIAEQPGAMLKFPFKGTAVGIFVAAGNDAGTVEYQIDGGDWKTQDLFTQWSKGLHIPWAYVLADELSDGPHELTLRVAKDANDKSKGHALRIVHFLVNGG